MSSFPRVYWAAGTKKFTHSFVSGFQTWLEFLNGFVISCHDSLTSIMSFSSCVVTLPAWPGRPSWPAGRRWPAEPSEAQSILRNPLCSQGLFSLSGDLNTRKITQQNCTIPLSPSLPQVPRSADYQKKKKARIEMTCVKLLGISSRNSLKAFAREPQRSWGMTTVSCTQRDPWGPVRVELEMKWWWLETPLRQSQKYMIKNLSFFYLIS